MPEVLSHRPVVLVVDDDPLLRMLARDVFEDEGFTVIEAGNGDAALGALEAHPDIGILFTDVDMPGGLDGLQLARLTHRAFPDIGVLVASGKAMPRANELPPGARFIRKPYANMEVVGHARDMLAAAA